MTKTSQIQAWLNGLYMENLYGQRMTSKHVHARRRPGVLAPVGDKTHPNLAPPLAQRTVRRSRISKSKSDLVAHDSGSWGVRLLHGVLAAGFSGEDQKWFFCHSNCGSFVSQFAKSFALNSVFVWKAASVYPKIWFCQNIFLHNIMLPKYDFAKISFCQSIVLPQYHFAKISFCQSIVFAKIWWCQTFIAHFLGQMPALIDILKLLVSLCISGSSTRLYRFKVGISGCWLDNANGGGLPPEIQKIYLGGGGSPILFGESSRHLYLGILVYEWQVV